MHKRSPAPSPRAAPAIVAITALASVAAHAAAAVAGPAGAMGWWMIAMAVVCLVGDLPAVVGRFCPHRCAGHLMAMNAGMILIHLVLLTTPAAARHQGHEVAAEAGLPGEHAYSMLALMVFEFMCMAAASAALHLSRQSLPQASLDLKIRSNGSLFSDLHDSVRWLRFIHSQSGGGEQWVRPARRAAFRAHSRISNWKQ